MGLAWGSLPGEATSLDAKPKEARGAHDERMMFRI